MTSVNFVADQKFEIILDLFRSEYPQISDVDIIKIAMSGFYKQKLKEKHQLWVDSLPELFLTENQKNDLKNDILEADNNPNPKQYNDVDLMMKDILSDNHI